MKERGQESTLHIQLNIQGAEERKLESYKTNLEVQTASLETLSVLPDSVPSWHCWAGTMKREAATDHPQREERRSEAFTRPGLLADPAITPVSPGQSQGTSHVPWGGQRDSSVSSVPRADIDNPSSNP